MIRGRHWRAAPVLVRRCPALLPPELGLSTTTASVLARRGLDDPAAARRFLEATETHDAVRVPRHARGGRADPRARAARQPHRRPRRLRRRRRLLDGARWCARLRDSAATVTPRLPSRHGGWLRPLGRTVRAAARAGRRAAGHGRLRHRRRRGGRAGAQPRHGRDRDRPPPPRRRAAGLPDRAPGARAAIRAPSSVRDRRRLQALPGALRGGGTRRRTSSRPSSTSSRSRRSPTSCRWWARTARSPRRGCASLAGTGRPGLRALMRVAGVEPQIGQASTRSPSRSRPASTPPGACTARMRHSSCCSPMTTGARSRSRASSTPSTASASRWRPGSCSRPSRQLSALPEHRDDPALRAGRRRLAPGRDRDRRLAPGRALPPPLRADRARRRRRGRGSARSIGAYDLHAGLAACAAPAGALRRPPDGRRPRDRGGEPGAVSGRRWSTTPARMLRDEDLVPVENGGRDRLRRRGRPRRSPRSSSACGRSGWEIPASTCSCRRRASPTCARWGRAATRASPSHSAGVRTARSWPSASGRAASTATAARRATISSAGWRPTSGRARSSRASCCARCTRSSRPATALPPTAPDVPACECRARGRGLVGRASGASWSATSSASAPGRCEPLARVVDRRGRGILGALSDLLSTGESLAVVCADCSTAPRAVRARASRRALRPRAGDACSRAAAPTRR